MGGVGEVQGSDIVCCCVYGSWQAIAAFPEIISVQTKSKQDYCEMERLCG